MKLSPHKNGGYFLRDGTMKITKPITSMLSIMKETGTWARVKNPVCKCKASGFSNNRHSIIKQRIKPDYWRSLESPTKKGLAMLMHLINVAFRIKHVSDIWKLASLESENHPIM